MELQKKSEKTGSVVVIRMGNLQQGEIDWSDLAYSNDKEDIEKYHLETGDVLFNRTNSAALVGKTSIYRGDYPAIYAGYLIKLDYNHDVIIGDFLNFALNTARAKEAAEAVLVQIDTMKKAILARAFRGKLGTNDPAEEWAGELLRSK